MPKNSRTARARGVINVNALVVAGLCMGLVSNVLIAGLFGLSYRVDAFFAASMLPNLFMLMCVDYLGKNFLPVLGSAKAVGEDCANSVTSSVVTFVAVLAFGIMLVLLAFREPLLATLLPGFSGEELALVSRYFAIMSPAIVLTAVNTFHEYVWLYEERSTYVSLTRTATPFANLAGLLLLAPWLHEYCLPVAYLAGHVVVFLMLLRGVPYRYRPQIALRAGFERRIFANAAVVMSTGLIARSRSIAMNFLASQLGNGTLTALALATKLTEPIQRSSFTGIHMLMFSRTVQLVVARDKLGIAALYGRGLRAAFLVLAPLLWWMALSAGAIVDLMFVRGRFTPEMANVVAGALLAFTPSVIFAGCNQLLSNAFYAMDRVKVPAIVMPLGTLLYVAAAVPLSAWLGTQGLAAATSLAAAAIFMALLYTIARQIPEIGFWRTAGRLGFYAVLAGTAMLGANAALSTLGWAPLAVAASTLSVGTAAYAAALYLGGDATFRTLLDLVRAYLGRTEKAHL